MTNDKPTHVLARFDEPARLAAAAWLEAFCDELCIDVSLFDPEELHAAVEYALVEPTGSAAFNERLRESCLGYLHAKMVELAREGFVLPTGLDDARFRELAADLARHFGEIQPREVGLYVYGIIDADRGLSFEIELPGRKMLPETTLDAGDAPLGHARDHERRLREAIARARISVTESGSTSPRRVPLAAFAAALESATSYEVIGPIAVR